MLVKNYLLVLNFKFCAKDVFDNTEVFSQIILQNKFIYIKILISREVLAVIHILCKQYCKLILL